MIIHRESGVKSKDKQSQDEEFIYEFILRCE